ncbi:peptide ABC transporter permease [Flavisphingomonas formosensis]|uniref:peptide ABC transporter permease n=1 Tax=Flavisphingomonas formosensis TaxID=861534 RepID=UPI0012FA6728|nr:peptide ABC transporter permease [Sphingomonas formosensis]
MAERDEGPVYSADAVRGGEIELRKPRQRYMFVGGLAAAILFALIMSLLEMV